ncbi:glycosyltransferase [Gracilibacillus massiliensis]|uniref:glycosyltransferase n=1 Tax=Gracilibacillus massiliensis TaxID=1564956 RepID=UPI00071C453D|nr:glycosyltransferase [Gracilibacillus massiliensis]
MNTYTKNYWSLYLDFIEDFKEVIYHGYRLSYLVHFPSIIRHHGSLWNEISQPELSKQIIHRVTNRKQVQHVFSNYLDTIKVPFLSRKAPIAILDDPLIRIPTSTIKNYFKRTNLLTIKTYKYPKDKPTKDRIYLQDFGTNTKQAIIKIQKQVDKIITRFPNHYLYQDSSVQHMLKHKVKFVINQINMLEELLKKVSLSTVIISSPNHFGRAMAFVAAKKGIPTICMQHGILGNEFGFLPKLATIDAVYGQFEKDWYVANGAPPESIRIIGHPRFDQALVKSTITKNQFFNRLKLDKRKKTLLLIVRGNRYAKKWQLLIKQIKNLLDINIILRDFPNDKMHLLQKKFPYIQSTNKLTLYQVLPHVDAVVSYASTVVLEAMLVGKPVFVLQTTIPGYTGYYNQLDPFVQKDPTKLASLVHLYFINAKWRDIAEKKQKKFLSYAYPDKSSSGHRLLNLVEELSRGEKK